MIHCVSPPLKLIVPFIMVLFCQITKAADVPTTHPTTDFSDAILTPAASASPKINGPSVYGQRAGRPFQYFIPATGDRPISYTASNLPPGLHLDTATGRITGSVTANGEFAVWLQASNAKGKAERKLRIVIGDQIALTPPMGWNSWNCWADAVDQEKVLRSAREMVSSGLINHGWTYINIDDTWQGKRSPQTHALQPDSKKFPNMKDLCDQIHAMGLKAGIYSTPWVRSYAYRLGGSAENPLGASQDFPGNPPRNKKVLPFAVGKYSFAVADATQWSDWGIDYLKYDWNPIEIPQVKEMADSLRGSGRDIVFSLSNSASFELAEEYSHLANCWRTTDDIRDSWSSLHKTGFAQDKWAAFTGPGHYNDPDMLVVGYVGWGPNLHLTKLTPNEQYTHITLWSLLSAPLLLGCDLDHLDPFTLNLLTNDEVLDVDQDSLAKQAVRVPLTRNSFLYIKDLEDGTKAVGLFNVGPAAATVRAEFSDLHLAGTQIVRDLWRQKDLGTMTDSLESTVASHGVLLVKLTPTTN